jgi:cell wall-associated NlpC family hydrolase
MKKVLETLGWALFAGIAITAMVVLTVPGKSRREGMASLDSFNAYRADTTAIRDSVKTDSTVKKILSVTEIDTRNVQPQHVVAFAKTLVGVPYRYASADPKNGFDCSGFITYVFKHFNIIVPRSSIDFTNVGKTVRADSARAGDLILFTGTDSTEKFVGHMGLVISNENGEVNFIHSSSGKIYGVTITPLNGYYRGRYMKTIRIF